MKLGKIISYSCTFALTPTRNTTLRRFYSQSPKPFVEIPGPHGLPLFGTLFDALPHLQKHKIHEYFQKQHMKYGPIYKDRIGAYESVNLFDPVDAERVLRNDGVYPKKIDLEAWTMYRQENDVSRGLLVSNGEEWHTNRSAVNRQMLSPSELSTYREGISKVAGDVLDVLDLSRDRDGNVHNLEQVLHRWALEGIGLVLFGERLGCISNYKDTELTSFVQAIHNMLSLTDKLFAVPPKMARFFNLKIWRDHTQAWDTIFAFAKKQIDAKASVLQATTDQKCLLNHLLLHTDLPRREVYGVVTDILEGAVDTTSVAIKWVLYMLACNPDVQSRLRNTVTVGGRDGNLMTYHTAIIKETLRLYPVGPILTRVLDLDISVRGFQIPAGTVINIHLIPMGRNPSLFDDPLTFKPERWLRDTEHRRPHPFAYLPFGFGSRSCIGKRIAELEICELLDKLCTRFNLTLADSKEVDAEMRTILIPERVPPVQFHKLL